MLSIVTTTKPFLQNNAIIQKDAIQSWLRLRPECEVILVGNDEGAAEVARTFGLTHVPVTEHNEYGSTLLDSLLASAQKVARFDLICYIHSDIILMSDFLPAIQLVRDRRFLVVGQRTDLDLKEPVQFTDPLWESRLRAEAAAHGKLHPGAGISYFVFPRGLYNDVPPFAIGRTGEDNWLIYKARLLNVPVIDATRVVTVIHQNHDYSHHAQGAAGVWRGPETAQNVELVNGRDHAFTTEYATEFITPQGVRPALTPRSIYFRMRAWPILHPGFGFLLAPFKIFEALVRRARKTDLPRSSSESKPDVA